MLRLIREEETIKINVLETNFKDGLNIHFVLKKISCQNFEKLKIDVRWPSMLLTCIEVL